MIRTALTLARKNLAVFPCAARGKTPATSHGCNDATTDPEIIWQWWRENSQYNVGVATGRVSGIFVVDVDDDDGDAALRELEAANGKLPPTVESITARGRHVFFKMPADRDVRNSAGKLAPHCDLRGSGGYVICPPSIHPCGRRYVWSVDSAGAFAEAPAWLIAKIAEPTNGNGGKSPAPASEWLTLVRGGISEGCRNDSLARLAGFLLRRHVDALVATEIVLAVNDARCRPPLEHDEVIAIIDSIAAREMKRRGI